MHVEQLFNHGSAVRKVMYTTNSIESVNSSFEFYIKNCVYSERSTWGLASRAAQPAQVCLSPCASLRVLKSYKKLD